VLKNELVEYLINGTDQRQVFVHTRTSKDLNRLPAQVSEYHRYKYVKRH